MKSYLLICHFWRYVWSLLWLFRFKRWHSHDHWLELRVLHSPWRKVLQSIGDQPHWRGIISGHSHRRVICWDETTAPFKTFSVIDLYRLCCLHWCRRATSIWCDDQVCRKFWWWLPGHNGLCLMNCQSRRLSVHTNYVRACFHKPPDLGSLQPSDIVIRSSQWAAAHFCESKLWLIRFFNERLCALHKSDITQRQIKPDLWSLIVSLLLVTV